MKKLLPVLIALLGLGAGVGAGIMLKPASEAEAAVAACAAENGADHAEGGEMAADCAAGADDPFAPVTHAEKPSELAYVPIEKSFVVPVFAGEKVKAMVVLSVSIETEAEAAHQIEALQPRLRDSFLKVLFRHANSGGFDGSFTAGRKMDDLKSALLRSAREVMGAVPVEEVLITEIARQDS